MDEFFKEVCGECGSPAILRVVDTRDGYGVAFKCECDVGMMASSSDRKSYSDDRAAERSLKACAEKILEEDPELYCAGVCGAALRNKARGAGSCFEGEEHPCFYCELFV